MTVAYGISLSMGWDKPMWVGFAVAFVSLATVGQSLDAAEAVGAIQARAPPTQERTALKLT
jgi:hypothetical protein